MSRDLPAPQGLYDSSREHDACGVSFVADIHGRKSHRMVALAVESLCHLEHRGATGSEANSGDGAGILIQVPDGLLRAVAGFELPAVGSYAVGIAFLPASGTADAVAGVEKIARSEGLTVLGWRDVPTDPDAADVGGAARAVMPVFRQFFVAADGLSGIELDRRAFLARKRIEHEIVDEGGEALV